MYKRLNCNEMDELISAYIDNELSQGLDEAVENHLAECENCTKKMSDFKKMSNVIKISGINKGNNIDQDYSETLNPYLENIDMCSFVEENLSEYIDDELSHFDKMKIKKHLKECKFCKKDYETLFELKVSLKKYFDQNLESTFKENDLERIVKRLTVAKFKDYLIVSMASAFVVSMLVWFSFNTLHPQSLNANDGETIQQINLKYKHEEGKVADTEDEEKETEE